MKLNFVDANPKGYKNPTSTPTSTSKNFFDYSLSEKKKIINAAAKNTTKMQLELLNKEEANEGFPRFKKIIRDYKRLEEIMKEHCIGQANSMARFIEVKLEPQQIEDYTMCRQNPDFNSLCDQQILYVTLTEEQKVGFRNKYNIDLEYLG